MCPIFCNAIFRCHPSIHPLQFLKISRIILCNQALEHQQTKMTCFQPARQIIIREGFKRVGTFGMFTGSSWVQNKSWGSLKWGLVRLADGDYANNIITSLIGQGCRALNYACRAWVKPWHFLMAIYALESPQSYLIL